MASPQSCSFYLQTKGRYCRMSAVKDTNFCGEHMLSGGVSDVGGVKRILCPIDSSHTVYEHLLKKHLNKCNAAKKKKPCCYVHNINTELQDYMQLDEEKLTLTDFSEERLAQVMLKVDEALSKLNENIETVILQHPVLKDELSNADNGLTALKHLKQQSSIIGHLETLGLLSSQTYYIEFGAGRGKLSHWVQLALQENESVHFTLVDRANCRRKFDLYHRFESQGPKFERLLIDIEHLDLVGISKHLCGSATDLALNCIKRYHFSSCSNQPCVGGIVIALCCHQKCEWKNFFGRDILERFGFNAVDFHILTHMASWAVCGQRPEKTKMATEKIDANNDILAEGEKTTDQSIVESRALSVKDSDQALKENVSSIVEITDEIQTSDKSDKSSKCSNYIPHPKEPMGLKCKQLIDLVRVHKFRECGFDSRLVHYVDRTVSLENVLLIAVPKS